MLGRLGSDEIQLTGDVTLTEVNNTFQGPNGLPLITTNITIRGNSHQIMRSAGAPDFRLFFVDYGDLTLINTTVGNGHASAYNLGGGIYTRGVLSLIGSTISGNTADSGGGIKASGTVTLTDSTVSGNSAGAGGGIATESFSTVTLTNSTVSGNNATSGSGGGIDGYRSTITLMQSTVTDNYAFFHGGGLAVDGGVAYVVESTFDQNEVPNRGGGIAVLGDLYSAEAYVTNSTLSGNSAFRGGGIIAFDDATAYLSNSTISGNSAQNGGGVATLAGGVDGTVELQDSLVGNSPAGGNCTATIVDNGNNLADDNTCGSIPDTLTGLDPILADDGGPTLTHALLAGSNAIDLAGDCGLATDQRLAPRDDGSCDSGSFEFGAVPPLFADGFESGDTSAWSATVP